eukprot:5742201-Pyramimonas_sp.AAC.1
MLASPNQVSKPLDHMYFTPPGGGRGTPDHGRFKTRNTCTLQKPALKRSFIRTGTVPGVGPVDEAGIQRAQERHKQYPARSVEAAVHHVQPCGDQ